MSQVKRQLQDPPQLAAEAVRAGSTLTASASLSGSVAATALFAAPQQPDGTTGLTIGMGEQPGAWPSSGHSTPPLDSVRLPHGCVYGVCVGSDEG